MQEFLEIGQIVNSYGLKGQMKIVPFTDDITRFERLKTIFIEHKKELLEYGYRVEKISMKEKKVYFLKNK